MGIASIIREAKGTQNVGRNLKTIDTSKGVSKLIRGDVTVTQLAEEKDKKKTAEKVQPEPVEMVTKQEPVFSIAQVRAESSSFEVPQETKVKTFETEQGVVGVQDPIKQQSYAVDPRVVTPEVIREYERTSAGAQVFAEKPEVVEEKQKKLVTDIEKQIEREQKFFGDEGFKRIEKTSQLLVYGGTKLLTPFGLFKIASEKERIDYFTSQPSFARQTAEKTVSGLLSYPIALGGTIPAVVEKISFGIRAYKDPELKSNVGRYVKQPVVELEKTSFSFLPGGTKINPEGASTLVTASIFALPTASAIVVKGRQSLGLDVLKESQKKQPTDFTIKSYSGTVEKTVVAKADIKIQTEGLQTVRSKAIPQTEYKINVPTEPVVISPKGISAGKGSTFATEKVSLKGKDFFIVSEIKPSGVTKTKVVSSADKVLLEKEFVSKPEFKITEPVEISKSEQLLSKPEFASKQKNIVLESKIISDISPKLFKKTFAPEGVATTSVIEKSVARTKESGAFRRDVFEKPVTFDFETGKSSFESQFTQLKETRYIFKEEAVKIKPASIIETPQSITKTLPARSEVVEFARVRGLYEIRYKEQPASVFTKAKEFAGSKKGQVSLLKEKAIEKQIIESKISGQFKVAEIKVYDAVRGFKPKTQIIGGVGSLLQSRQNIGSASKINLAEMIKVSSISNVKDALKPALDTRSLTKSDVRSDVKTDIMIKQQLKSFSETKTVQETKQVSELKSISEVKLTPSVSKPTSGGVASIVSPPIIPIVPLFPSFSEQSKVKMVQGYVPIVVEKGKDTKASVRPLPYEEANRVLRDVLDNSVSASGRIVRAPIDVPASRRSKFATGSNVDPDKFRFSRDFKKGKTTIVEKRANRIDTIGESRGLTASKLIARYKKGAKIWQTRL